MKLQLQQPPDFDPARFSDLRALLSRYDFQPRKRLGQNFLISPQAADRIIKIAQLEPDDKVLEIGSGAGALTMRLAQIAKYTIALEIDSRLVFGPLDELFASVPNIRILQEDVLKCDLIALMIEARTTDNNFRVLGNLPYYITGPILAKLLEQRKRIIRIVVMVQKEVADRIVSPPGSKEYGGLSVMLQAYFDIKREFIVKRACFHPMPEVDSAVLSFTPKPEAAIEEEYAEVFETVIKAAFAHRRKTLENSLVDSGLFATRQDAIAAITAAGLTPGRRAETLSVADYTRLAERVADVLR